MLYIYIYIYIYMIFLTKYLWYVLSYVSYISFQYHIYRISHFSMIFYMYFLWYRIYEMSHDIYRMKYMISLSCIVYLTYFILYMSILYFIDPICFIYFPSPRSLIISLYIYIYIISAIFHCLFFISEIVFNTYNYKCDI